VVVFSHRKLFHARPSRGHHRAGSEAVRRHFSAKMV